MLGGNVNITEPVVVDKDTNEIGAMLMCDTITAAALCDVIRSHDRRCGDRPTRVYVRRGNTWKKVSGVTPLAVVVNGGLQLNPEMFPSAAKQKVVVSAPPVRRPILLGG